MDLPSLDATEGRDGERTNSRGDAELTERERRHLRRTNVREGWLHESEERKEATEHSDRTLSDQDSDELNHPPRQRAEEQLTPLGLFPRRQGRGQTATDAETPPWVSTQGRMHQGPPRRSESNEAERVRHFGSTASEGIGSNPVEGSRGRDDVEGPEERARAGFMGARPDDDGPPDDPPHVNRPEGDRAASMSQPRCRRGQDHGTYYGGPYEDRTDRRPPSRLRPSVRPEEERDSQQYPQFHWQQGPGPEQYDRNRGRFDPGYYDEEQRDVPRPHRHAQHFPWQPRAERAHHRSEFQYGYPRYPWANNQTANRTQADAAPEWRSQRVPMHTEYDVRGPAPTRWRHAEFGGGHEQPMDPHRMNRPEFRMPPPPLGSEVFNDSHGHPQAVTTPSRMDGERRQNELMYLLQKPQELATPRSFKKLLTQREMLQFQHCLKEAAPRAAYSVNQLLEYLRTTPYGLFAMNLWMDTYKSMPPDLAHLIFETAPQGMSLAELEYVLDVRRELFCYVLDAIKGMTAQSPSIDEMIGAIANQKQGQLSSRTSTTGFWVILMDRTMTRKSLQWFDLVS